MSIEKNYIVAKRNILNEFRASSMSLQELRFFSIYLSKINPKDTNTRIVRFPLSNFKKIMELDSRLKIDYLKQVTNSLLSKVVNIPLDERGNYTAFQLFKRCTITVDETGEQYIEIDAHDDALPLMFEFKNKYFTYQLWNALRLKSSNQLRMYEILKQYETIGERIVSVDELKELLGIDKKDYSRYGDFKMKVINICRISLENNTDIKFICEPTGKKGRGGKILNLKFYISKNTNCTDQLSLDDFIDQQTFLDDDETENRYSERLEFFSEACNSEFSISEIQVLYNLIVQILSTKELADTIKVYHFYKNKYDEMKMRSQQTKINKRFGYLKSLFESELN